MMSEQKIIDWLDESEATSARFGENMTSDEYMRLEMEIEVLQAVLK